MTDHETPPRVLPHWIYVALALACAATACSVALHPSGAPTHPAPGRTTVPISIITATAVAAATPSPSPIPRLTHLDIPPDLANADVAGADAPTPAAVATEPEPARTAGSVTLERRGDLFVAPARIAGQPIGDLLLDTGAGATFIDQRLADDRRLPEIITASTEDGRADREASIRELHGLTIGDLPLATDRAFVVDLRDGDTLIGGPLAGVIGLSAFGSAPFTIDFPTGTLTVHTAASFEPPASVQAEALRTDQGLPFVEARLANGTSVWLLLDSGSSAGISVWRGFAKQHPGRLKSATAAITSADATPSYELRSLRLFGEKHDRLAVQIQDAPGRPWQRARVVGRVGMGLLRDLRITIHPATERIWVERPLAANDHQ